MKSFLLFIVSVLLGAAFNSMILNLGMEIIPPPEGYDMNNPSELAKAMAVMEPKHFLFPFLAHASGTLLGVIFFTYFSKSNKLIFSLFIAGLFFAGGFYMVLILPAPIWFNVIDLVLAYFPMSALGFKLAKRNV